MKPHSTRREFLRTTTLAGTGALALLEAPSAFGYPANEKLNVALVGVAGRGSWFVDAIPGLKENVVAMCDVNERRAKGAFDAIPQARKFHDFRQMLDAMDKEIDCVVVATPDNTHAVVSAAAMHAGKGVYCEKPLAKNVFEARKLREIARQRGVATQMGNQGTASAAFRQAVAILQAGLLGEVHEAYVWNTNGGPGEIPVPTDAHPVPDYLHWDLWLGPAKFRPYHSRWLNWHSWRDFGTGQLGNWGCHTMNVIFKGLSLDTLWKSEEAQEKRSVRVSAEVSKTLNASFPRWEKVQFDFPARPAAPPIRVHWHNGSGKAPAPREMIEEVIGRKLDWGDAGEKRWQDHAGCLILGAKGSLHSTGHNASFSVFPKSIRGETEKITSSVRGATGHEREWLDACRGGKLPMSNFDYSGPLTEFALLGNVATLLDREFTFDPVTMKVVDNAEADRALYREYRAGWSL